MSDEAIRSWARHLRNTVLAALENLTKATDRNTRILEQVETKVDRTIAGLRNVQVRLTTLGAITAQGRRQSMVV